jgi:glutathione S-transferase
MEIVLYHAPLTAAMVVRWLLIELDWPHEIRTLDLEKREHKSEAYLKLNPAGVIPTLVIDGQVICESTAIVMHLADLAGDRGLAPPPASPERGQYYRWMVFMANSLQPAFRAWFYPSETAGPDYVDAAKRETRAAIERVWDELARHLSAGGPYLLGERLSAADFLLTVLMRWSRNMPKPSDRWPALHAHAQRMKARPSFKELYVREGITDWV